jgi:hypothetical protein
MNTTTGPTVIAWDLPRVLLALAVVDLGISGMLIGLLATTRARMTEEHPTTVSRLLLLWCIYLLYHMSQ